MALSAEELYRRGVEHSNAGRHAAARRALVSAAERAVDPDLRARIAGTRAYLLTSDRALGEEMCREALAIEGIADLTRAVLEGQLGLLAIHRGDPLAAVDALGRGIEILPDASPERARMFLNRSVAWSQLGDLSRARVDLAAAVDDNMMLGEAVGAAIAQHNLGYVQLIEGDLVSALSNMTKARMILAPESDVNAAIGDVDRAQVLRDAGLVSEAEALLESAADVFRAQRMRQLQGETELNLARSLLRHDAARAARAAASAERRFAALGGELWRARAAATRARALLAGGTVGRDGRVSPAPRRTPTEADVAATADALDLVHARGEADALRLTHALWRVRHGQARAVTVPRTRTDASVEVRLLAEEVRAARGVRLGRLADARRAAARGIDELTEWQSSFGSLDLQTSVAMHGTGLLREGIAAAVGSKDPAAIFEWSERARLLSEQVVPLRPPPDLELASWLTELRNLRAENPADAWLSDPRARELGELIRERQWSQTAGASVRRRVDLAELRSALDADTALCAYVFDTTGLHCLVATRDAVRVIELERWGEARTALTGLRADLDVAASVRTGPMAAVVRRSLDDRLALLSRALVDDVIALTGARRLVLTVPGVLAGMPWAMLPGLHGRALTLAGSASRWVAGRAAHDTGSSAPSGTRPLRTVFAAGPRVARAEEEIASAASAWRSPTVLTGSDATVDAVLALPDADLLHVAAHGRHSADSPLFSGLEVDDGVLFGYDIDRMPRVPDTVVLSACEVGRSSVRWGQEAVGMTRAWLHAGANCVVAAPVVVADDDACALLGEMHANLAAGSSPALALAAAAESTGIRAPFQCHGDGF